MLSFQYKYLLWGFLLLPILLLIFFYARQKRKIALAKLGDSHLVDLLLTNYKKSSYSKKFMLLFFAIGMLLFALANLRMSIGSKEINRTGVEMMIALDVSKSMLAQDIQPNRLERAKQFLSKLIDKVENSQVGIVVFAGRAYLQMPLSSDHSSAKMLLNSANPVSIPTQGTNIGEALKMCNVSFASKEKKYKVVVLVSDGEDHDADAISVTKEMAENGVVVHAVGIGSVDGAPILEESTGDAKKDKDGNAIITKLNEQELRTIAQVSGGGYEHYTNSESAANNIANEISKMDKKNIVDESLLNYKSLFQLFLGLALILLIIELFISETRNKKFVALKSIIFLPIFFLSVSLSAQVNKKLVKEGNNAYKKNDYDSAINSYKRASKKDTSNSLVHYNMGNALYKSGKHDEATNAYDKSIGKFTKPVEKSNAYYNKGVVMQNNNKLEDCITAYKNALRLTPNDEDARLNLQKALQKQQQQKQQQNKDKNKSNNKKQDEKKDNNNNKDQKEDKPKPQPSKLSQKEAEEKLKALAQEEKQLQDKLRKTQARSPNNPDKDW